MACVLYVMLCLTKLQDPSQMNRRYTNSGKQEGILLDISGIKRRNV
jgi:hypothetical protein